MLEREIENITVKQLYDLPDDEFRKYMTVKKMMKPKNSFNKTEGIAIGELSFSDVSEIKRIFISPSPEGIFETFSRIFKVSKDKYLRSDVISYFYAFNWISESVKTILTNEHKTLTAEYDEDTYLLEEAGINRLQIFEEFPTLVNIAQQFSTSPQVVETWKYNLVFAIMAYNKVLSEIQKKHEELKQRK